MNPESISRKEILSISRQLLHKDKEIFIFSFFYIAWRVGAWVFLFWAMYTLLQPTSATKNMTPYALVLIFILISFFTSVIYAFYYALTVQCVGDRLQGEDPTFLSTLAKISSKWKTILKIYLKFFRPLPFKYFVLSGSVQEFLFQEILLNMKKL